MVSSESQVILTSSLASYSQGSARGWSRNLGNQVTLLLKCCLLWFPETTRTGDMAMINSCQKKTETKP